MRAGAAGSAKIHRRRQSASVSATRRCMISATAGLHPPSARLIIIVASVVWRLGRRSSAGRRHCEPSSGLAPRKRAMLAIEVHRHRSSPTLDGHGIYGWLDLAAADRAPPAERELAVYSWVASEGWMPARLHKAALRDGRSERPRRVESRHSQITRWMTR
jgi:hypothetical protein